MPGGFLIRVAFLFVWRSWRSTLALSLMIFAAVAALVFLSSLAVGTNDAMIRNSVGLFSGHIAGHHLPADTTGDRLQVHGVAGSLIRKERPARLHHNQEMEHVLIIGVHPAEEKRLTSIWKKTVLGRYLQPGEAALFLSQPVAEKLKVTVGELVQLGFSPGSTNLEWPVIGIYRTGVFQLDHEVAFCPADVFPDPGSQATAAVFLKDGTDPDRVLEDYRKLNGTTRFQAWTEFMPDLKQLIDLNWVSMGIVMVLVFSVVSLGISCAFVIFIYKNLREHGIMKTMGILPVETAWLILWQVVVLTLVASLAGLAVGAAAVAVFARSGIDLTTFTSHNQYFAVSGVIYPRLTLYSAMLPPLLALVFGKLATVWPAVFVIRSDAADILRSI